MSITIRLSSANLGSEGDEELFDAWAAFVTEHVGVGVEVHAVEQRRFGEAGEDEITGGTEEDREAIRQWLSVEGWNQFCESTSAISEHDGRVASAQAEELFDEPRRTRVIVQLTIAGSPDDCEPAVNDALDDGVLQDAITDHGVRVTSALVLCTIDGDGKTIALDEQDVRAGGGALEPQLQALVEKATRDPIERLLTAFGEVHGGTWGVDITRDGGEWTVRVHGMLQFVQSAPTLPEAYAALHAELEEMRAWQRAQATLFISMPCTSTSGTRPRCILTKPAESLGTCSCGEPAVKLDPYGGPPVCARCYRP